MSSVSTSYLKALLANIASDPEPTNVDERRTASDPNVDPVADARRTHEQATQAATEAEKNADRVQATQEAQQKRDEAANRSKAAFKGKPSSPRGKMMHQTAAMAHKDAADHYKKLSSASSGHTLEARGEAAKRAQEHSDSAERHESIGQGKGDPQLLFGRGDKMATHSTGSRSVTCEIINGNPNHDAEGRFTDGPGGMGPAIDRTARAKFAEHVGAYEAAGGKIGIKKYTSPLEKQVLAGGPASDETKAKAKAFADRFLPPVKSTVPTPSAAGALPNQSGPSGSSGNPGGGLPKPPQRGNRQGIPQKYRVTHPNATFISGAK